MTLQEKIKHYTHFIIDENGNEWEVVETSDLSDIMETYHLEQSKDESSRESNPKENIILPQEDTTDYQGEAKEMIEAFLHGDDTIESIKGDYFEPLWLNEAKENALRVCRLLKDNAFAVPFLLYIDADKKYKSKEYFEKLEKAVKEFEI